MAAPGLQSEAVLKLRVQLDSRDIRGTKKLLTDLTNAFKAQSATKGINAMEKAIESLTGELREAKVKLNAYKQATQDSRSAERQATEAKKAQLNAYKQLAAAIIRQRVVQEANTKAVKNQNTQDRIRQVQLRNLARQEQLIATAIANTIKVNAAQANVKKRANAEAKRATEQAKAEAKALKELEARQRAEAKALAEIEKRAKLTSTAIGRMKDFVDRIVKSTKEAEKNFDALFRASYRLNMVGNMFKNAARAVMDFGSGIMESFGDFEYMMIRAAGTMEIWWDAAREGNLTYADLQNQILELAGSMKMFPAKDIAEAMYFWGSTTGQVVKTQEDLAVTTESLDTIMKAAVMTNTSYEQTIKGVYSILQQYYGGSLEYATEVTEKLFYTTQKTAAEFGDMIAAFKMVGPIAAQMGASFDEVNETIATLADLGLRGTMAGRALRQMFIQTIRPSGPAGAAMDQLFALPENAARFDGKKYADLVFPKGQYVGITKQVDILAKATMNLTQAERGYYLAKISTANELPMLTALVAKQTAELRGLATAEDKLADSGTKAAISFQKNWEGMSQSWNAVKGSLDRAIESFRINIGSIMAQVLKPLLDTLTLAIRHVEAFIKLNPGIVRFFTQIGSAVASLSAVVGQFLVMAGAASGVAAAFGVIIFVAKELMDVLKYVISVGGALSVVFLAIIDNAQYVYDAIAEIGTNLQEAFGNGEDAAIDFGAALETITRPVREIVGWIVRLVSDIGVWISEIVKAVAQIGILRDALNILIQVISALISARILVGLAMMTKGFLGIGAALGGITSAANVAGGAIHRLMAGGIAGAFSPAGWAALAATVAIVALQIPEVQDAINGLIGKTDRWGESVENLKNKFKELGIEMSDVTLKGAEAIFNWEEAIASAWEGGYGGRTPTPEMLDKIKAGADLREQGKQWAAWVNDEISKAFDLVNIEAFKSNEPLIKESDWIQLILNLTQDLGGPQNASLAKSIAVRLSSVLGSETTISEAYKLWASHAFGNIDFDQFLQAAGYFTNLGKTSSKASEHAMQVMQAGFKLSTDPAAMSKFLTTPLEEFMGYSISAIAAGEGNFTEQARQVAGELMNSFQNAVATAMENQAGSISGYQETLKRALESMTIMMFEDAWPDFYTVAAEIEGLVMNSDWAAVADLMMGTDAIKEAIDKSRPGSSEFKSLAQMLIDYGYGSPAFIAMFGEAAEDAGEEAGKTASRAWIDGLAEGASSGFSKEDVRKALKLGRGRDMVRDIMRTSSGKNMNRLMGGGVAARNMGMGFLREHRPDIQGWLDRGTARSPEEGARRLDVLRSGVRAGKDDMAPQVVRFWNNLIKVNKKKANEAKAAINETLGAVSGWFAPGQRQPPTGGGTETPPTTAPSFGGTPSAPTSAAPAAPQVAQPMLGGLTTEAQSFNYSSFLSAIYDGVLAAIPASTLPVAGYDIAKSIVGGLSLSLSKSGGGNTATAIGTLAANAANASIGAVKAQGAVIASNIVAGVQSGLLGSSVSTEMTTMVQNSVASMIASADQSGFNVGSSWSAGFARGVQSNTTVITASFLTSTEAGKGESPPKKGPLKDIDKWGYNVGAAWGESFTRGGVDEARKMARRVRELRIGSDRIMNGGAEIKNTHKREVTVKLEVSSPDGTVNRQKQADIRRGAMDALVVAGLEHYVTVG